MAGRLQFVCQKCRRSLEVSTDTTLQENGLVALRSRGPTPSHLDAAFAQQEKDAMDALADSFIVLPAKPLKPDGTVDEEKVTEGTLDKQHQALAKAFEVISDKCQLDHPLCQACVNTIMDELEAAIKENEHDAETYSAVLARMENDPAYNPRNAAVPTAKEEAELAARERKLTERLREIEAERAAIKQEKAQLDAEARQLDMLERRFWESQQDVTLELMQVSQEELYITQRIEVASEQLERLKRTNVADDAFHISFDGHFGTINGFRLGRLPSQQVDWQEINAALGQVVLLLHTIASRDFKFSKYKLIPMGSFSRMSKLDDESTIYELYGSNDFQLGKLFWYRRFDTAMTWLLECIQEFAEHATRLDPTFQLKYPINGDKIGSDKSGKHSVKLQLNNDANWTKALKFMLTDVKCLLAWASKHRDH